MLYIDIDVVVLVVDNSDWLSSPATSWDLPATWSSDGATDQAKESPLMSGATPKSSENWKNPPNFVPSWLSDSSDASAKPGAKQSDKKGAAKVTPKPSPKLQSQQPCQLLIRNIVPGVCNANIF